MADIAGRLYLPTAPGWYWFRDNGQEYEGWGVLYELTEPTESGFSWINQGSATTSTTDGGVYLTTPAPGGAGENVRIRTQAVSFVAPTSDPYIIIAGFMPLLDPLDNTSAGLIFRDSVSSEFIYFSFKYDTTSSFAKSDVVLSVDKYDNATTFNSNYSIGSAGPLKGGMIWMRIEDDSTNLSWSFSNDGKTFMFLHAVSRTDFLASGPDQIGYAVNSTNTGASASMTLLSWIKFDDS